MSRADAELTMYDPGLRQDRPLRVLTISHLFPTEQYRRAGIFICREADLLQQFEVNCSFLVPRPWVPWPMGLFPRWSVYAKSNRLSPPFGLQARSVAYTRPPGFWFRRFEGGIMARALNAPARRWHHENPFDLVLGVDLRADTFAAVAIAKMLGLPAAGLAIGDDVMVSPEQSKVLKRQVAACVSQLDLAIGVSQAICAKLRQLGRCKREPLCVYLGRDESLFFPPDDKYQAKSNRGWGRNEIVAVYVGVFFEAKGIRELVMAARSLFDRYPRFHLVCVGTGPLVSELQTLRNEQRDPDKVRLLGRLAPEDVPAVLRAADFLVLPSHSEGLPQVVLEAMNCGLPVVATRVGGTPEAVLHGETGLLVEPHDVEALVEAMSKVITDEDFRHRSGASGLARAKLQFDGIAHAEVLGDALKRLVEPRPVPTR